MLFLFLLIMEFYNFKYPLINHNFTVLNFRLVFILVLKSVKIPFFALYLFLIYKQWLHKFFGLFWFLWFFFYRCLFLFLFGNSNPIILLLSSISNLRWWSDLLFSVYYHWLAFFALLTFSNIFEHILHIKFYIYLIIKIIIF